VFIWFFIEFNTVTVALSIVSSVSRLFSTAHKEREQSGDRTNDGENSCKFGYGTSQMAQPWMFMMMMMMINTEEPL
jgi:hypothetical protein